MGKVKTIMNTEVMGQYKKLFEIAETTLRGRNEASKVCIQVGSATCENAAGAEEVFSEFKKYIAASGRKDIVLRKTGCTGRCSCEPIVGVIVPNEIPIKYERVDRELAHEIFSSHIQNKTPVYKHILDGSAEDSLCKYEFLFCGGDRCGLRHDNKFREAFSQRLQAAGIGEKQVKVIPANCFGLCRPDNIGQVNHIMVRPGKVIYRVKDKHDIDKIIQNHVLKGQMVEELLVDDPGISRRFFNLYGDVAFFNRQSRLALRNSGVINPEDIYEYMHYNGFEALARVLEKNDYDWVINEVTRSKLRGRGGAGYPTGKKWSLARKEPGDVKYIVCNADEGDPGAFMDRSMLEGDPFSVIEGMIIGGFAIGAHNGYFYIRAEYPLAIKRVQQGIDLARKNGLLGKNILGSGFDFDLEIRLGAGAFVCGEETSLIHSIEGERGEPRIRPPYPAEKGLWGKPTVINNVETFANVPVVLYYGGEWFSSIGTDKSGGTKVFALAGKVRHTGLVEVPMGTTLREIVHDIGGGPAKGKQLKAIQTGGPAGGCIPAAWIDTPVDYETLTQAGSIMGSGGMIIMDEDDCMVDIAKFYMAFSQDESCGKCTPCREGTKRMLEILERITGGQGTQEDLERLERLARLIKKSALCGLGRAAPNPVLSTLTHFKEEYQAHVVKKRCPAKKCVALIHYEIKPEACVGCTVCAKHCPVACIAGQPKKTHVIDQERCIRCGRCFQVCRFGAVDKL
jgi:NADP-reducing hydrogenase subunit HndC